MATILRSVPPVLGPFGWFCVATTLIFILAKSKSKGKNKGKRKWSIWRDRGYTLKDTIRDTGATPEEGRRAWRDARRDAKESR